MARKKAKASAAKPGSVAQPASAVLAPDRTHWWIALGVAVLTLAVFGRAAGFDFVRYDDDVYLFENRRIMKGLNWPDFLWALTTNELSNWYPLTRWSHQLDFTLFGVEGGGHHMHNIVLHALNSALLFFALRRLTGAMWPSALAAALFAVHPLRVESVVWVVERKDVLSGFFWISAMWAYAGYAERPERSRYWCLLVLFILGLASKPSVVTLPAALLLLDYWPLRRLGEGWKPLVEKLPLFALAAAVSLITSLSQKAGGSLDFLQGASRLDKLANVPTAYLAYLGDTFWPSGLAVLYPFVFRRPLWVVAGAVAILALITAIALWRRQQWPWLAVGWLWFLGVMVPMSGIVQIGLHSHADRYTYLPHIGLFVALVWTAHVLLRERLVVPGAAAVALCGLLAWVQTGYWRDTETLFKRAIRVAPNSSMRNNLGITLMNLDKLEEARQVLETAIRINPREPDSHSNLAAILVKLGRFDQALSEADQALRLKPQHEMASRNRGLALAGLGRGEEALRDVNRAIELSRSELDKADNINTRGELLIKLRRYPEAQADFETAMRMDPEHPVAQRDLANALAFQQRYPESLAHYEAFRVRYPRDAIAAKAAREIRDYLRARRRSGPAAP